MSKTIALNQTSPFAKIFSINAEFLSRSLFLAIGLLLFSLLAVSVWQTNAYSRDVFLLQDMGRKMNEVAKENKALEINFNKSNSLANFSANTLGQSFEKAIKIDYVRIADKKVVSRAQ